MQVRADEKAEEAVLGSILIGHGGGTFRSAAAIIRSEMFFDASNRAIWQVVEGLSDTGKPSDMVTVMNALQNSNTGVSQNWLLKLDSCNHAVGHQDHVGYYAEIVARMYYEREILKACRDAAKDPGLDSVERVRGLVIAMESVGQSKSKTLADVLHDKLDRLGHKGYRKFFNTGYKGIDQTWMGMRAGEVNTWAAATNDGKSVLLLNILVNGMRLGYRQLYFGTEMSADELANRVISIAGGPEIRLMRDERLDDTATNRFLTLADELGYMGETRLVDNPEPSLAEIDAAISEAKPEAVFLDYLERFTLPREENMRLRVKEFMRQIKTMARRHGVVIHLASQLNRHAYGSDDKPPSMADISESSAVEKESDRVVLIHQPKANQPTNGNRTIQTVCAKNRHGRRNTGCDMTMDSTTLKIEEG